MLLTTLEILGDCFSFGVLKFSSGASFFEYCAIWKLLFSWEKILEYHSRPSSHKNLLALSYMIIRNFYTGCSVPFIAECYLQEFIHPPGTWIQYIVWPFENYETVCTYIPMTTSVISPFLICTIRFLFRAPVATIIIFPLHCFLNFLAIVRFVGAPYLHPFLSTLCRVEYVKFVQ